MSYRLRAAATLALGSLAGQAHAAGFALIEQNASGLGNAYADQAASAQDASTIFFNPAGMTLLPDRQVVMAGHLIRPQAEFSGGNDFPIPPVILPSFRMHISHSGSHRMSISGWA